MISYNVASIILLAVTAPEATAFAPRFRAEHRATSTPRTAPLRADTWDGASASGGAVSGSAGGTTGSIEQIEFKIHADGRVEETVRGVKGNNCHQVTEKINEALGKTIASEPTHEMFEQEVKVTQKIYQAESDWEGSSSW